jgi:uncharacterized protein YjaZ
MKVLFTDSDFWTKDRQNLKEQIQGTITSSYKDVREVLPYISSNVNVVVQVNHWESIPKVGGGGHTRNSELVLIFLDPDLPLGEEGLLDYTKSTTWHELNHAARFNAVEWSTDSSFINYCIIEGLATVFERDYTGYNPPWGEYKESETKDWVKEIKGLGNNYVWSQYMFLHPDGRKWIGYKTGTYIVDQALKNSKKTISELTKLEYKEILKLANLG